MTKRTDMFAALACQAVAQVPIWEIEFQAWDAASGRHVVLGEAFARLTPGEQERAMEVNAEIILGVCRDFGFAALTVPNGYWYHAPGELAYYVMPGDTRFRQCEILKKQAGNDLVLVGITGGVLGGSYDVEFCQKLFDAPEEVEGWARQSVETGVERARRFRDLGVEIVVSPSDMADNSGPFFPPAQMRRFILPYLNEWAERCAELGLRTILHSDGNLTPYLNDLADTALDALQAIDPTAGMDMREAKRIVGDRLCLCGNLDCGLLLTGTPARVAAATQELLAVFPDRRGLVLGASNAVQPEVPMANYRAMLAAVNTELENA